MTLVTHKHDSLSPSAGGEDPEYLPIEGLAKDVVRRRLLSIPDRYIALLPALRHARRLNVFTKEDVVLVYGTSYTSARKCIQRSAKYHHPFPGLYSTDANAEANFVLPGSINNGISRSSISNYMGPAIRIDRDSTFMLVDIDCELAGVPSGEIHLYRIDIAMLLRLGRRITRLSFEYYFEIMLISFLHFMEAMQLNNSSKI
jgi:hypothetical protein